MGTKSEAIETGYQLPDGTLLLTDVLVAIDFNPKVRGGPVRGGEFAQSHFAQRLRALRQFEGMSLVATIEAMKRLPNLPWTMRDYACHVARGRCIVARNGKLLDHKGNVTTTDARVRGH
jgi:hypothetical protein